VRAAQARYTGAFAPTAGALKAGAYRVAGASRVLVRNDRSTGTAVVFAVDPSWAMSTTWFEQIGAEIVKTWLGFGCRYITGTVLNQVVTLDVSVVLRDANSLADTSGFTDAIRKACVDYFDERPDFYIWRTAALKALISHADRAVLKCTSVVVRDENGRPLSEPTQPGNGTQPALIHFWLGNSAVNVTYFGPQ